MRVLLTGASGFLGSALAEALRGTGHHLVLAMRHPEPSLHAGDAVVAVDFARDVSPEVWRPRLAGVDAVINAVGILREHGAQTFQALHVDAPVALFEACVQAQVSRVIQISALGADEHAASAYHLSKHRADEHLLALPLSAVVVQPSLVFGAHGASAQLFTTAAALPLIPLPGRGAQCLQPVHLDDVCAAVLRLLETATPPSRVALVGPQPLTLRAYLATLRGGLGLSRARFVPVPMRIVRGAVTLAARLPGSLADDQTLQMLERGNCADSAAISRLLGRAPRAATAFIGAATAPALRCAALLRVWSPLLRLSIALVWLVTGIVSFGVYPVESSLALLARTGITGVLALIALYAAAALDLVFGIATLAMRRRRRLYQAQLVVILGYTAIITWHLPEFWWHPYGPILKNLPMLAAIWLLHETEPSP